MSGSKPVTLGQGYSTIVWVPEVEGSWALPWTLPKLSTPEQSEHWSDLLPLMTWQLWLARDIRPLAKVP